MCPHLSNLNHNNGSDINAPNVVTDLSNISNQGYDTDQIRFDTSPITEITSNNSHSNSNRNGDMINSMSTVASATTTTSTTMTTAVATSTSPTDDSRLRHSSMDRLMSLLNDLGNSTRTRSLSDGGQEEGKFSNFNWHFSLIHSRAIKIGCLSLLFPFDMICPIGHIFNFYKINKFLFWNFRSGKRDSTRYFE